MRRVQIRLLETHQEFRACESIQKAVWGNVGVGGEALAVTQKYGGTVLGAVVDGTIVGFIYAFLARRHGRLIHWSHLMAVEAEYRDLGLGYRMKLTHRKLALRQGVKSICWTFDPLQSRNATLNIARLRARVEEYIPNCYGIFPSAIEQGLASDRFVVDWRIASLAVERRLRKGAGRLETHFPLPHVNETRLNTHGFLENTTMHLNRRAPRLLVEVPPNTDEMRAKALPLARRWRNETRRIFQRYLRIGYRVADFLPPNGATGGKCFYVLGQ